MNAETPTTAATLPYTALELADKVAKETNVPLLFAAMDKETGHLHIVFRDFPNIDRKLLASALYHKIINAK